MRRVNYVTRSKEGEYWKITGELSEKYVEVLVIQSGIKWVMSKSDYERRKSYPTMIPLYRKEDYLAGGAE